MVVISTHIFMFHRHTFDTKQTKEKIVALSVLWAAFSGAFLLVVKSMF